MRRVLPVFFAFFLSLLPSHSLALQKTDIITTDQIHAGMKGVAYTVFEGVTPEPIDVEVLGVMPNANGPKGDIILVRLHGQKVEYTGVVAGMSGSPVYLNGKLAGALAFRIGEFSKEPIAGVTPIEQMLEINALDRSLVPDVPASVTGEHRDNARVAAPGPAESAVTTGVNYMQPIAAPLVLNGFSEDTVQRFMPQFSAAGLMPVMGVGSVSGSKQPEKLQPGSAISAVLVRGDMNMAATCTVTYVDSQSLLACGHPLLQFGQVHMPMYKARVLATLPSPANAFKIVNVTEPVGTFVQDRHAGILGRFDEKPHMIPVTLNIHGGPSPKQFHYEVLNNGKITPVAMMATVFQALQGVNAYGEDVTYRLNGHIDVAGLPYGDAPENVYGRCRNTGLRPGGHPGGRALQPHLRKSLLLSQHQGGGAGL